MAQYDKHGRLMVVEGDVLLDRFEITDRKPFLLFARDLETGNRVVVVTPRPRVSPVYATADRIDYLAEIYDRVRGVEGCTQVVASAPGMLVLPFREDYMAPPAFVNDPFVDFVLLELVEVLDGLLRVHEAGLIFGGAHGGGLSLGGLGPPLTDFRWAQWIDPARRRYADSTLPKGISADVAHFALLVRRLLPADPRQPYTTALRDSVPASIVHVLAPIVGAPADLATGNIPTDGWPTLEQIRDMFAEALADVGLEDPRAELAALRANAQAFREAFPARAYKALSASAEARMRRGERSLVALAEAAEAVAVAASTRRRASEAMAALGTASEAIVFARSA